MMGSREGVRQVNAVRKVVNFLFILLIPFFLASRTPDEGADWFLASRTPDEGKMAWLAVPIPEC